MEKSRTVLKTRRRIRTGKEALSFPVEPLAHPARTIICNLPPPKLQKEVNHYVTCKGFHPINTKVTREKVPFLGGICQLIPFANRGRRLRRRCSTKAKLNHIHNSTISAMNSFSSLPSEIVEKIFSYFTQRELCLLAQVSKVWRDFVYDPIHWQRLSFELNHNLELDLLKAITERTPLLKKLSLHGRENLTVANEVTYFTKRCSLLQDVDLSYLSTIDRPVIEVLSENCSRLQNLSIEGCVLVDHQSVSLLCQKLRGLRNLNLSGCSGLMDKSIELIADHLSKLQRLNIDGIPDITDRSITVLSERLGQTLECLHVDGSELSDSAIEAISQSSRLKHLCISNGGNLTDTALTHIQRLSSLQQLRLRRAACVTSLGLAGMFTDSGLQSLSHLDLTECSMLDDSCVQALVQCCGSSVCHLDLSLCWNISDVGLQAIVGGCRKLQHLDLLGLDSITGEPLQKIPEAVPSLSYVDLRQCSKINDELMIETVKKKPSLTILNYYGEEFRQSLEPKDSRSVLMATHLQILLGFLLLEMLVGLICMC